MPTLHQYDYLFAFGVIFCTLDAFMIGKSHTPADENKSVKNSR